jgi:hypothetical protein
VIGNTSLRAIHDVYANCRDHHNGDEDSMMATKMNQEWRSSSLAHRSRQHCANHKSWSSPLNRILRSLLPLATYNTGRVWIDCTNTLFDERCRNLLPLMNLRLWA